MNQILSGWKDIANYMGKGVRTVQPYAQEGGLPIRRMSGTPKASVLVTRAELDEWIRGAFDRKAWNEKRSADLENVKSRTLELRAAIEQFRLSMRTLSRTRNELSVCRRTVRQTVQQVHRSVFPALPPEKDRSLRVA